MIVVHCSGSRCNHRYTLEQLRHDHVVVNGWRDIGYHFYITQEGVVYPCRPVERMGAHALGYNAHSIGICYEAVCRRAVAFLIPARQPRRRR